MIYIFQVTQLACDGCNLAPSGCLQWHSGRGSESTLGSVMTFNYASNQHLANQQQVICIR